MYWFLIDCICAVTVSGAVLIIAHLLNVGHGFHILFTILGSFTYFFGKYLTGSGVLARYHYINTVTPELIWKFAGIICWIIAAISIYLNLP